MKKVLVVIAALGIFFLLSVGILVAYVGNDIATVKRESVARLMNAATRDLYDPESVRFRDLRLMSSSDHLESVDKFLVFLREERAWVMSTVRSNPMMLFRYNDRMFTLCGQLNAKNRMGAYVGYTDFYVSQLNSTDPLVAIDGAGWSDGFIANMCGIGVEIMRLPDGPGMSK
jgi:hypothetical protein